MNVTTALWIRRTLTAGILALPLLATTARAADKKAERAYKANCASCHGAEGKADTEKGQAMKMADISTAAWQQKFTDAQIKDAITKGVHETRGGVKKDMDGFGPDKVKPEQLDGLVAYIRSLAK
jgi:mono/diheme cytochrome c family protein